jgi:hypothetical protein
MSRKPGQYCASLSQRLIGLYKGICRTLPLRAQLGQERSEMTEMIEDEQSSASIDQEAVRQAIQSYVAALQQPAEMDEVTWREERRVTMTKLWQLIEPILWPIAKKWNWAYQHDPAGAGHWHEVTRDLCTDLCIHLIQVLPTKVIHADGNVVALIRIIARNYSVDLVRRASHTAPADSATPQPTAKRPRRRLYEFLTIDDEQLHKREELLISQIDLHIDEQHQIASIVALRRWINSLSATDRALIEARLVDTPYEAIAKAPGEKEILRLRKQYSRLLVRAREYLKAQGFGPAD